MAPSFRHPKVQHRKYFLLSPKALGVKYINVLIVLLVAKSFESTSCLFFMIIIYDYDNMRFPSPLPGCSVVAWLGAWALDCYVPQII